MIKNFSLNAKSVLGIPERSVYPAFLVPEWWWRLPPGEGAVISTPVGDQMTQVEAASTVPRDGVGTRSSYVFLTDTRIPWLCSREIPGSFGSYFATWRTAAVPFVFSGATSLRGGLVALLWGTGYVLLPFFLLTSRSCGGDVNIYIYC